MTEDINDTELEPEVEPELGTPAEETEETVEDFDTQLEGAETDEDFAKLGESLREEALEEVSEESQTGDEPTGAKKSIDNEEPEEEVSAFRSMTIKDGDIELVIDNEAKAIQLMQMGLNYGGKTTELAKHRSFVQYAEENGISLDDIQMLRDIKNGNKDAYSQLAKTAGIDIYDVTPEQHEQYTPEKIELSQEPDHMVDAIANEILANEDHTAQFKQWLPKMPPDIQQAVTTDANTLRGVQEDIAAGVFNDAMQEAYTQMRINGADFGSAYVNAKQALMATKAPQQEPKPTVTRGDRRRASSTRGSASSQSKSYAQGVISDMSDDEFLENFNDILKSGLGR